MRVQVSANNWEEPKTLAKTRARYDAAENLAKDYFADKKPEFTKEEMYSLIKDFRFQGLRTPI